MQTSIVWFRRDLRVRDNAALEAAIAGGRPVVAVAVMPESPPAGAASRAWRHLSLAELDRSLRARGNRLVLQAGTADATLQRLASECSAVEVHCTRDWAPAAMAEEQAVSEELAARGVALHAHEGQLLSPPDALTTGSGGPYRVFTPFHRAWMASLDSRPPRPAPPRVPAPASIPRSDPMPPAPPSAPDIARWWVPGEDSALARLEAFAEQSVLDYPALRDLPATAGTSELSAHVAFGEITPRQVLDALHRHPAERVEAFVRQLAWREFAYHVMHHHPRTATEPLRPEFHDFPWHDDPRALRTWAAGETGYALVDAGMKQLSATGWMHNRVRLITASFLVKDLLVPWQTGEAYFREHLVDYDPAVNVFNWQWVAGCGADAAPYFRVFNPLIQQRRFDMEGEYVARWLGEGARPAPIVDHAEARLRALAAYRSVRRTGRDS